MLFSVNLYYSALKMQKCKPPYTDKNRLQRYNIAAAGKIGCVFQNCCIFLYSVGVMPVRCLNSLLK